MFYNFCFCTLLIFMTGLGKTSSEYAGMKSVFSRFSGRGFDILAFPCGQFLGQELSCDMDIKAFAQAQRVQFTMMSKVDVNGENEAPIYSFLKNQPNCEGRINWNFSTKFLVSRGGRVQRLNAGILECVPAIETLLDQSS